MSGQVTIKTLQQKKDAGKKITMLTAYDYPMAKAIDKAGIDVILVGDSVGMVVLGYEDTLVVTVEDMIHHSKAVTRGANDSLVVTDLPFMAYKVNDISYTVKNAGQIIKESGAQAVKLEGGSEIVEEIEAINKAGIPVMGHLGLTPQSVNQFGGFKVQGKGSAAKELLKNAKILEEAGVFALVLECIPAKLATRITNQLSIPTIGIGAGKDCNGQVLVTQDMLGVSTDFTPKFVREYTDLRQEINQALNKYKEDVKSGEFPNSEESFSN
ncbi:3-methyl-2-oxobutanoate hydroxymethyltransferase [Halobacteroides halobius DSM 5150]|uniref:3-methyl-2-oxobutanoate hydroxymethyltransferase n=1 Tax=Halobacteroides halobius (strain ATCC 35273 / DSM 5150 / MD-1) TaxID=748449 RepID=L0K4F1_HALHC|nr:3-methyl-2-oxobutanoate hydroxymethyltransferase [Halobacteroides halobius]AGB40152.1 3-methyl-2-oxobutanoate hydroxymethyltransferase [Halobacteroides halobius DSM 5150]